MKDKIGKYRNEIRRLKKEKQALYESHQGLENACCKLTDILRDTGYATAVWNVVYNDNKIDGYVARRLMNRCY